MGFQYLEQWKLPSLRQSLMERHNGRWYTAELAMKHSTLLEKSTNMMPLLQTVTRYWAQQRALQALKIFILSERICRASHCTLLLLAEEKVMKGDIVCSTSTTML